MQVTVIHNERQEDRTSKFVPVAVVEVDTDDVKAAMNHAMFLTQNIEGSWSKGDLYEWNNEDGSTSIIDNPDYRENITVIAPLPVFTDKETGITNVLGHRSSMGLDRFEVDGVVYEAGFIHGFKKVA